MESTIDVLLRTGEAPMHYMLQKGRHLSKNKKTGLFTEDGERECLRLEKEVGVRHLNALLDHDNYVEHLNQIHPVLVPRLQDDKTEQGLMPIRKGDFAGNYAQWFGADGNAIYISRTLPRASNSALQLSDILCSAHMMRGINLSIRPDCYRVEAESSAAMYAEFAAWYGAKMPRTFAEMDKLDKEVQETYGEDEICDSWRLNVLVKPQGEEVEVVMEELPVGQNERYCVDGAEYVVCRFIHARYRKRVGMYHLDGAVAVYEGLAYDEMWVTKKLSDRIKPVVKRKIFRMDGDIPFDLFARLTAVFYKWNWHIVDYFWPEMLEETRAIRRQARRLKP